MQLTVTNRDISRLLDIADPARLHEPDPLFPPSVLHDLAELVPCDTVLYQSHDPYREVFRGVRTEDEVVDVEPGATAAFFAKFWISSCSLPERIGNHNFVSAYPDEIMISLPQDGQVTRRILLVRDERLPFSEREVRLMTLIRPHLAEMVRSRPIAPAAPTLTVRQQQTLRLAGAGLTNRQIARRLTIAEGTVRKHLENAYATLDVTNRTAAAARINQLA